MKKIFKSFNLLLFTIILTYTFCVQGYAIKYTDGRFITNTKVHEFVNNLVVQQEDYKEISGQHGICFNRIAFSFLYNKQNSVVKRISLYIPVINYNTAITFYVKLYPKGSLSVADFVNLFLNSNEFNEQAFNFNICNSVSVSGWCGDAVNEYDDKYSIATDITEENWREKFSDEESVIPELCPGSLIFFEIRPGEKVFVEGYDENYDE